MKEDILEQIIDDWLLSQTSTFTKHNVKFRPDEKSVDYNSRTDSSYSDIDIIGVHMDKLGKERVSVVSCKSWQDGFNPKYWHDKLVNKPDSIVYGKEAWKTLRELVNPKWGKSFSEKVYSETKSTDFIYYLAVTKLIGTQAEKAEFEKETKFLDCLKFNKSSKVEIKIITLNEVFDFFSSKGDSKTLEATTVGRLLQVLKASGKVFSEK
jgi:hypothetical protein